jgi:hypothetical protein
MATVTVERIAALQAGIAAAINQTSEHSTLSEQEQESSGTGAGKDRGQRLRQVYAP